MSIINKPPEMVKRGVTKLQEPIAVAVEKYAAFIASTPDHVVNSALKMVALEGCRLPSLRKQQQTPTEKKDGHVAAKVARAYPKNPPREALLACILAAATGVPLYFRAPFPDANLFIHVMALRSSSAFLFFKYSYTLFPLHHTLHRLFRLLSGIYIFALKATRKIRAGKLPLYPEPAQRANLSLLSASCTISASKCRRNTALAGHSGTRTLYGYRHR